MYSRTQTYIQFSRKYGNILLKCTGYVKNTEIKQLMSNSPMIEGFLCTQFTLGYSGLRKNINIFL